MEFKLEIEIKVEMRLEMQETAEATVYLSGDRPADTQILPIIQIRNVRGIERF